MTLTPLGLCFLPVLVLLAWRGRLWLLLPVAAVLQAGSVANVGWGSGRFGVTAFSVVGLGLALGLLPGWRARWNRLWGSLACEQAPRWLLAYGVCACSGALLLPLLFAGLPVFALDRPLGFDTDPSPLALGVSQWAQVLNMGVLAAVFASLWSTPEDRRERLAADLRQGLLLALVLVLLVGAWERMSLLGWVRSSELFWMSNPGYTQSFSAMVAGVLRVSAPFSEPSYASSFLAAALVGLLTVAAFGRRARTALLMALPVAAALLNTLGSSGLVASAVGAGGLLLALGWVSRRAPADLGLRRRAFSGWGAALALLAAGAVLLWVSPWAESLQALAAQTLTEKFRLDQPGLMGARHRSNLHGLDLLLQTRGLGVGMGGNRASSYLVSLLSNVGLIGSGLWLGLQYALIRPFLRAGLALRDAQWFALGAWFAATVAVALAIPDLNFPAYWLFLLFALAQAPRASAGFPVMAGGDLLAPAGERPT